MNDLRIAAEKECGEELEFLCVRMPDAVYGFELACIREIIWNSRITPVPCVPEYYEGLCNWKGTIIPAASLNRMTGEEESAAGDQPVIVIAEAGTLQCGFLVQEEPEILRVLTPEGFSIMPSARPSTRISNWFSSTRCLSTTSAW